MRFGTYWKLVGLAPLVTSFLHDRLDLDDLVECAACADLDADRQWCVLGDAVARAEFDPEQRLEQGGVHEARVQRRAVDERHSG